MIDNSWRSGRSPDFLVGTFYNSVRPRTTEQRNFGEQKVSVLHINRFIGPNMMRRNIIGIAHVGTWVEKVEKLHKEVNGKNIPK